LQGTAEGLLHDCFDRVMTAAGIADAEAEFTFPSIASEDRTAKLQDLAFAESMGWVSKQTAASIGAKELGITGYDFEEEQKLIALEFPEPEMEDVPGADPNPLTGKKPQRPVQGDGVVRRPMIAASQRQAAKLDPTKSPSQEDEPPGLLVPLDGSTTAGGPSSGPSGSQGTPNPPSNGNGATAPGRAGFPKDENPMSSAGAANIRKDNRLAEGEPVLTFDQAMRLVREAREPRRRPDDPAFREASEAYRQAAQANLAELVRTAAPQREAATGLVLREGETIGQALDAAIDTALARKAAEVHSQAQETARRAAATELIGALGGLTGRVAEAVEVLASTQERARQAQLSQVEMAAELSEAEDRRHRERLQAQAGNASREISALAQAVTRIAERETVVNVTVPEQPAPQVTVQPTPVQIREAAPVGPRRRKVERDADGNVTYLVDE
jgi:hypothetical protein